MGMDINETWSHDKTRSIYGAFRLVIDYIDGYDSSIFDADITYPARFA
jgi:hypothetical protein